MAKSTWRDHGIPSRWPEKVDRTIHPHIKPIGLIARLIGAATMSGKLVIDPSFVVMRAANAAISPTVHLLRNAPAMPAPLPSPNQMGSRKYSTNP
jgi:hypothetical protein